MKMAPNLQQVSQQFAVNRPNQDEAIWQPLYDYQTYATAGATVFTFFQTPIGQSSKTIQDTNMKQAGLLAAPQKFLLTGIEVAFFPGSPAGSGALAAAQAGRNWADAYAVLKKGIVRLSVGSKDYVVDGPLMAFPPQFRLAGSAAIAAHGDAAATVEQVSYASAAGRLWEPLPIFIPPVQNFVVTVEFAAAVATPSTVDAVMGVRLNGFLYRLSQ